ncbi:MAG: PRD domain-containing protein, partial [Oscillospiraceae bacterium]|nr:PRD domain-containing protein [Oscillospiraceae bacterium]
EKLSELMKTSVIECVIGAWDPKLFSLPFLPMSELLNAPPQELGELLSLRKQRREDINFDEVYAYLGEQLEKVSVKKLRKLLPRFIRGVNETVCRLSVDTEIGLFVHVACCINRLLEREPVRPNAHTADILRQYDGQFKAVSALLQPLEASFGVIFSDDELANILMIIYKL